MVFEFKWHKVDPDDTTMLNDHNFYLVTHKHFCTPMKAKWHDEGEWEILGTTQNDIHGNLIIGREFWFVDDPESPIVAWTELPEIYDWRKIDND